MLIILSKPTTLNMMFILLPSKLGAHSIKDSHFCHIDSDATFNLEFGYIAYMISLHIRFYVSVSRDSLAVAIKLKAKYRFHVAAFFPLAF
jgi:hypothetical protein